MVGRVHGSVCNRLCSSRFCCQLPKLPATVDWRERDAGRLSNDT
jgi:hypothetical protein